MSSHYAGDLLEVRPCNHDLSLEISALSHQTPLGNGESILLPPESMVCGFRTNINPSLAYPLMQSELDPSCTSITIRSKHKGDERDGDMSNFRKTTRLKATEPLETSFLTALTLSERLYGIPYVSTPLTSTRLLNLCVASPRLVVQQVWIEG